MTRCSASAAPTTDLLSPDLNGCVDEPRPCGVEELAASSGLYRVRFGSLRVVLSIDDDALVVEVVKIGDRKDVYRRRS